MKKELFLLFFCLAASKAYIFARGGGEGGGGGGSHAAVRAAVTSASSREQVAGAAAGGEASEAATEPGSEQKNGYLEAFGGYGTASNTVGKSALSVSFFETDGLTQTNERHWNSLGRVGLGYVYYFGNLHARYVDSFEWFPSIEPMASVYFFNLHSKGNVYLFNNKFLNLGNFDMPVRSASLMVEAALSVFSWRYLSAFLLAGGGGAWSTIRYHDSANSFNFFRSPLHLNKQERTSAVYEWGAGATFKFKSRFAVSLEYLYTHIGNVRTAKYGRLGGIPVRIFAPAGFSLRTQAVFLNLHVTLFET